jgi:two-component system, LytTR family, response regulator
MSDLLRAVIVEDEPIARDLLQAMLDDSDMVEVVGAAGNVADAVSMIRDAGPDLIFLDIRMPDGTGFDVLRSLGREQGPSVVFVTAYDEYAVRAFDVMALDYLMKPFDEERLHESVRRVRSRLSEGLTIPGSELLSLLRELQGNHHGGPADRLPVDARTHVKLIPTADVDWIEAKGKHVLVHTRRSTYSMREGISTVAQRLDPREFLRVHRSAIVRVDRVMEIHRWTRGDYRFVLEDGTKIVTGMTYRKDVEARLLGDRRPPVR